MRDPAILFARGDSGHHTHRIPAIVAAGDQLVVFAEGRRESPGDAGEIVIMARTSADGGATWSPAVTVTAEAGFTCGNPAPVSLDDDTVLLVSSRNGATAHERDIVAGTVDDEQGRRVRVQRVQLPGLVPDAPRDITAEAKRPDWGWYATGPGHAFRLRNGRIVVPANHSVIGSSDPSPYGCHALLSDDDGEHWHIGLVDAGHPGCSGPNESSCTEVGDGDVVFSVRNEYREGDEATRAWTVSADHGESAPPLQPQDLDIPRVQAAITTVRVADREVVVLSGPSDPDRRAGMSLRVSADRGRSWSAPHVVDPGPSAYSDLCVDRSGNLHLVWERGHSSSYEVIAHRRWTPEELTELV